jgi:hypothetical protein
MELRNVRGKTHDHRKVRKRTSPGGIRVIVFIFSRGRHYGKDDLINGGERPRLGKELKAGDNLTHARRYR